MQSLRKVNNSIAKWCALDIQELPLLAASFMLRLLPWVANPGNPAMSPHAEGKKGACHTDIIYIQWKKKTSVGRGGEGLCSNVEWHFNKHKCTRDPRACGQHKTTDCTGPLMLAPRMHCHRCMNKQRKNAGERRPLPHALGQVSHKTLLGMREH